MHNSPVVSTWYMLIIYRCYHCPLPVFYSFRYLIISKHTAIVVYIIVLDVVKVDPKYNNID